MLREFARVYKHCVHTRVHNAGPSPDVLRVRLDLRPLADGPARVLRVDAARRREHEATVAILALPDLDRVEHILWVLVIS